MNHCAIVKKVRSWIPFFYNNKLTHNITWLDFDTEKITDGQYLARLIFSSCTMFN